MTVQAATIAAERDELWYTRCSIATSFGVTQERGLFDHEFPNVGGLRWLSIQESDDAATRQSHFTHLKERSFRHGGNVPALWARSRGADTRLIGLTWLPTADVILATSESAIGSAGGLRGKRLLVLESPTSEIDVWKATTLRTYEAALSSVALGFEDVTLVPVEIGKLELPQRDSEGRILTGRPDRRGLGALKRRYGLHRETLLPLLAGEVDAVVSHAHFALELAALGGLEIVFDQGTLADPLDRVNLDVPDALTVSGQLLEEDPDVVTRVVARLLENHEWAVANPAEALASLARELDTSTEILRATHGDDVSDGFDLTLDPQLLNGLAREKEFLLRHGFVAEDFDLDSWVDPAPLERARELVASRTSRS